MTGISMPVEVHAKHSCGEKGREKRSPHSCALSAHPLSETARPRGIGLNEQDEVHQVNMVYSRGVNGGGNPTSLAAVDCPTVPQRLQSVECRISQSPALHPCASRHVFFSDGAPCVSAESRVRHRSLCLVKSSAVAVVFYTPNTAGCHPDAWQHPDL